MFLNETELIRFGDILSGFQWFFVRGFCGGMWL